MAQVRKRQAAKSDLIAQWDWYAENAGVEVADRFLAAAESTALMLASQPESGVRVSTTKTELAGLRRFPMSNGFEKIHFFYFPIPYGIDLIRVVHGNRELDRLLITGFFG